MIVNREHNPRRVQMRRNAKGFALVVALILLGFLLMIGLSLSALVNIELMGAQQSKRKNEARENARLALTIALGKLQEAAGPDQRISARARLLDEQIKNPWWTGIWKSYGTSEPVWLVSGEDPDPEKEVVIKPVVLVSERPDPSGAGVIPAVVAESESLYDGSRVIGNIAWWIGDEGVKANYAVVDPYVELIEKKTGATRDLYRLRRFQTAKGYSPSSMTGLEAFPDNQPGLEALLSDEQILLLAQDIKEQAWRAHIHDLTAWSMGVLADVKSGGLKRDLTQAFEIDSVYQRDFLNAGQRERFGLLAAIDDPRTGNRDTAASLPVNLTATVIGGSSTWQYKGPNFGILRDYYRLHDKFSIQSKPSSPVILPDNPGNEGPWQSPYTGANPSTGNVEDQYHTNHPLMPVVAHLQLGLAASLYLAGTDADGNLVYRLQLESKPVMALYNPHGTELTNVNLFFRWSPNPRIRIHIGNGNAVVFRLIEFFPTTVVESVSEGYKFHIKNADFQPGETRFFSITDRINYAQAETAAEKWWMPLEADYNEEGSFFLDVINTATATVVGDSDKFKSADDPRFGLTPVEKNSLTVTIPNSSDPQDIENALKNINLSIEVEFDVYNGPGRVWALYPNASGQRVETFDMANYWLQRAPEVRTMTYNLLDATGMPSLITFAYSISTTTESHQAMRPLVEANVRPMAHNGRWEGFYNGEGNDSSLLLKAGVDRGWISDPAPPTDGGARNRSSWVSTTGSHVPLFDMPSSPLATLASFQHAHLSRYNHEPTYAFGNSFANIRIPRDEYFVSNYTNNSNWRNYDLSFVLNQRIWDQYFFSTIPYWILRKEGTSAFDAEMGEILSGEEPLINSQYVFRDRGVSVATFRNFTDPESLRVPASQLLVNGAFNVNSDSVEAWKALLGSMRGVDVPVRNPETGTLGWVKADRVFSRFMIPWADDNDFWKGFRALSEEEIEDLATAIVNENRKRGPFRSLADFVNRRLANDATGLAGTLQAAIDATDINAKGKTLSGADPVSIDSTWFHNNSSGPQATGFPGYLTQADVLQAIGAVLSIRSDTFRIRAYGSVTNPLTGVVEAEAWCEAIVQRTPIKADGSDPLADQPDVADNLGRRFEIVSFRWLPPDEI